MRSGLHRSMLWEPRAQLLLREMASLSKIAELLRLNQPFLVSSHFDESLPSCRLYDMKSRELICPAQITEDGGPYSLRLSGPIMLGLH